uniref:rRNA biogenesis protein RRP36 n=1 Tax=Alona affinis TaxID=381656 RepID=A0A9N6WR40_9CRUS|nr:EOG090X0E8U [Alona affinis]
MSKKTRFEEEDIVEEYNSEDDEDDDVDEEDEADEASSGSDVSEDKFPVLSSIVNKGKVAVDPTAPKNEDTERLAIRQELSNLSFEELQKLKEKIGSKKFNNTLLAGGKKKSEPVVREFKRANPNRPREMSSKSRKIEVKQAIQVPKVFKNDPRFDNLCGEFHEKKFHRNYEFVNKMKEEEVAKLKEEIKEEANPRRVEKMKYLIQRMENQIRAEKKRKEEEEKEAAERQTTIEALKQGINPHFASKSMRKEKEMKDKFEHLKKDGRLDQYMAKKRKHNAQRDRKSMPMRESSFKT